mmetsp:Transcript_30139/g.101592  ORF Transcript_30139/g.101592 Transcript_30139/m.101592 type:complete len:234 (-) Transcript_30139:1251-1952(-)
MLFIRRLWGMPAPAHDPFVAASLEAQLRHRRAPAHRRPGSRSRRSRRRRGLRLPGEAHASLLPPKTNRRIVPHRVLRRVARARRHGRAAVRYRHGRDQYSNGDAPGRDAGEVPQQSRPPSGLDAPPAAARRRRRDGPSGGRRGACWGRRLSTRGWGILSEQPTSAPVPCRLRPRRGHQRRQSHGAHRRLLRRRTFRAHRRFSIRQCRGRRHLQAQRRCCESEREEERPRQRRL